MLATKLSALAAVLHDKKDAETRHCVEDFNKYGVSKTIII